MEGRNLVAHCALPPKGRRVLHSAIDMNAGREVYSGRLAGHVEEVNLKTLVPDDKHPYLLLHWVILGEEDIASQ